MDHGQWLLSHCFPQANGLHSVLAFEGKNPSVAKGQKDFVQVINVNTNHWVTVTNIGCYENSIDVYDSLSLDLNKNAGQKMYSSMASLVKTDLSNLKINYKPMQQQQGCSDCGLFALAVAFTLLAGDDPSELTYDQSCMREHLTLCFLVNEMAPFPSKSSQCQQMKKTRTEL